ncbi:S-Ena type endospore appendage [Alteribacter aurantiacus]|uniref:S-Ena type endospore appendage n=1 Tax=Alteribacter aurantiacus TaxID=254410 RepID=UPI00041C2698|nr:S-Ena type endospore appendage [Alteribacter aurantiacus]
MNRLENGCFEVDVVYDWLQKVVTIPIDATISLKNDSLLHEKLCSHFLITLSNPKCLLWESTTSSNISGSFNIKSKKGCTTLKVIVNGKTVKELTNGGEYHGTFHDLRSIELEGTLGEDQVKCEGEFGLIVYDCASLRESKWEDGFISKDEYDIDVHVTCEEVTIERKSQEIMIQTGHRIELNRIRFFNEGCLRLSPKYHGIKPINIPFHLLETFYLCAPDNTNITCDVELLDVELYIKKKGHCLTVVGEVTLCQRVIVKGGRVISFHGVLRKPRKEFKVELASPKCPF